MPWTPNQRDRRSRRMEWSMVSKAALLLCPCPHHHSHSQPESCCWWVSHSAETVHYHSPSQETLSGQRKSFCVNLSHDLSEPHQSCYGVPHGSVLGPLLFSVYITPLSSLISSFSLSHHLYADDTQLFLSFQPTKFDENLSCLQTALSTIADWMTSNLLCFNSAKIEFLLLGLKPQLNKIHNPALSFVVQSICSVYTIYLINITQIIHSNT